MGIGAEVSPLNKRLFLQTQYSFKGLGGEVKSLTTTTTTRSSLNDTTTVPVSARSVSFKEPIVHENDDSPSSQSRPTTTVLAANSNKLGIESVFLLNIINFMLIV